LFKVPSIAQQCVQHFKSYTFFNYDTTLADESYPESVQSSSTPHISVLI